jgi:hypothetical protein
MCFSAAASFTASSVLFVTGGCALYRAMRNNPKYIFLALVPIFFAIQQAIEGAVWLNPNNQILSFAYLFFAYFMWPPYIGLSVYAVEEDPKRKKYLMYLTILGFLVGCILYVPAVLKWYLIKPSIVQNAICYHVDLSDLYVNSLAICYLAILFFDTILSSNQFLKFFGALLALSFVITYLFYQHAFTSVWCFFGAILSIFILMIIPKKRVKK